MKQDRSWLSGGVLFALIVCLILPTAGCGGGWGGTFLAFGRKNQIWTARADGTDQKQLTDGFDDSPAVSPDGRTIIYSHSEQDPTREYEGLPEKAPPGAGIYAIPSGGGEPQLLTPESWLTGSGWTPLWGEKFPDPDYVSPPLSIMRDCIEPSYSPDGKSICFIVRDNANWRSGARVYLAIATMNANGTGEPQMLHTIDTGESVGPRMFQPRFSPDGSEIYVSYFGPPGEVIGKIPANGGELTLVTNSGYFAFAISNEQNMIAAVQSRSATPLRIILMGLDGSNIREIYTTQFPPSPVVPGISWLAPLSFTPSGDSIAFVDDTVYPQVEHNTPNIYLIPIKSGEPRKIITFGSQPCFGRKASE